jgi:hypothetical protein
MWPVEHDLLESTHARPCGAQQLGAARYAGGQSMPLDRALQLAASVEQLP